MQVWKFGGTSVGKPERMKSIRQLITEDGQPKIVVLSALSGSTNTLLSISASLNAGNVTFNVSSWSNYSIGETPLFAGGNGTINNPYQIASWDQLNKKHNNKEQPQDF